MYFRDILCYTLKAALFQIDLSNVMLLICLQILGYKEFGKIGKTIQELLDISLYLILCL